MATNEPGSIPHPVRRAPSPFAFQHSAYTSELQATRSEEEVTYELRRRLREYLVAGSFSWLAAHSMLSPRPYLLFRSSGMSSPAFAAM